MIGRLSLMEPAFFISGKNRAMRAASPGEWEGHMDSGV